MSMKCYVVLESTEYWCGQNLIDGAVTAIQTQILVGAAQSEPNEQAALKVCPSKLHCGYVKHLQFKQKSFSVH